MVENNNDTEVSPMSQADIIAFYQRMNERQELRTEFERLMADNLSLIVAVKLAEKHGFRFTTRELAEHIILSSADHQLHENIVPLDLQNVG